MTKNRLLPIYTVRKRPVSGIAKKFRPKRSLRGIIYVPGQMIGQRIIVIEVGEYWKWKMAKEILDRIKKLLRVEKG